MATPQLANVFAHPPFDKIVDPFRYKWLIDTFISGRNGDDTSERIGDLGWVVTDVAGAANSDVDFFTTVATVQTMPGIITLNTGPTTPAANDEASLSLPHVDSIVMPDGATDHVYVGALVRFPSIASVEFNFGLFDAAGDAGRGTNGVSVEFDASADAEFNLVITDGGSSTATASSTTVAANTWYLLELAIHEDSVQLRINRDELVYASVVTNTPDDVAMGPAFKVATEAAAEKSVSIGGFALKFPLAQVW